jgi:hypothetical protein
MADEWYEVQMPEEVQFETELALLVATLHDAGGDIALSFTLPNRWGLSILRKQPTLMEYPGYEPQYVGGSYGASAHLFEVALMMDGEVTFDGPILHQPEGWLSPAEVAGVVRKIYALEEAP